jgi:hypothetical protein
MVGRLGAIHRFARIVLIQVGIRRIENILVNKGIAGSRIGARRYYLRSYTDGTGRLTGHIPGAGGIPQHFGATMNP